MTDLAVGARRRESEPLEPLPPSARRRLTERLAALVPTDLPNLRSLLVALLMAVVAVLAGNIFDRFEWRLLLGVAGGLLAVVLGTRLPARVPPLGRVACVLLGLVATAAITTLLTGGTLGDAFPRLIDGPRRLLTTEWPSPRDPTAVGTVALMLATATAAGVALARWPRLHLAPLAPVLAALIAVVSLSAPRRPEWWLIAVLAALAALLALARQGERPLTRVASLRGERAVVLGTAAVVLATAGTATVLALPGRADPRQVSEPDRSASLLLPLEATVAMRHADPPVDLFTITDESPLIGQRMPSRWRTAAVDQYDGQRWVPRAAIRPIGERLGEQTASMAGRPAPVHYRIDVLTATTDLVPLPGRPIDLESDPPLGVETDTGRVVVRLEQRPPAGSRLRLVAELAPTAGEVVPAAILPRTVDEIAGRFTGAAERFTGSGDALTRLQRLEQELRTWKRDPSAQFGGQQLRMIEQFVNETRRGNAEQFATAFVLLARSLGFDARVATGFVVDAGEAVSPLTIRTDQAAVWPEVNVADIGWMAFDPLPAQEANDAEEPEPTPDLQPPPAAQPPVEPPTESSDQDESLDDDTATTSDGWGSLATWMARVAAAVGLVAVPLALAVGAVLAAKHLRRRRRYAAPNPADQVRGSWANVTDALVDAGLDIEPSWTDDRIAAMGAPLAGHAPHQLHRLAAMSTAATFGPAAYSEAGTDAHRTEQLVATAIGESMTAWQRLRWRLSLRSLRRATRSPVNV